MRSGAKHRVPTLLSIARVVLIALGVALGVVAAGLWIRLAPAQYEALLLVGPADALDLGGPSALDLGNPALSSVLAGGPAGAAGPHAAFARYLALLPSPDVAAVVIQQPALLAALAPDVWDPVGGRWHAPTGVSGRIAAWRDRLLQRPRWTPPSRHDMAVRVDRALTVRPVGATGLRRLAVRLTDPHAAATLLETIHTAADRHLRTEAAAQADARIAYLYEQLGRAAAMEHRQALYTLLVRVERERMLIQDGLPYAARPVGSIAVSSRPVAPNPLLLLPAGGVAGGVACALLVFAGGRRRPPTPRAGPRPVDPSALDPNPLEISRAA